MNQQFIIGKKTESPMFASTPHRKFYDVIILWRHTVLITADYFGQTSLYNQ